MYAGMSFKNLNGPIFNLRRLKCFMLKLSDRLCLQINSCLVYTLCR